MKRFLCVIIAALMLCALAGCAAGGDKEDDGKITIVTTIFPLYDMAEHICEGSDGYEITMLLKPGQEIHTYEPTPTDIKLIGTADIIFCIGGESESWLEGILETFDREIPVCRLIEYIDPLIEEDREGMQDGGIFSPENGEIEYDEHIWTAPAQAVTMAEVMEERISEISGQDIDASSYIDELKALDKEYHDFFDGRRTVLIFGDRFPFAHLAREFDIEYYAAFPGCYEGSEPSAATMAFLIDKVKEENVSTVYYIEFSNHRIADAIAESCGCNTAMIHSCHNVTAEEISAGMGYIELMRKNLETFKETIKK